MKNKRSSRIGLGFHRAPPYPLSATSGHCSKAGTLYFTSTSIVTERPLRGSEGSSLVRS